MNLNKSILKYKMSDTSTLNSETTLNLETGQSNLQQTIFKESNIKLQNKSSILQRWDKILFFISLIINGTSVVLLEKKVSSIGIILYLISWLFLFSRFIRM
jgi:hypothetical protein